MARDAGGGLRGDARQRTHLSATSSRPWTATRDLKKAAEKEAKDDARSGASSWRRRPSWASPRRSTKAKIATRNAAQDERKELQRRDAEVDAELNSKAEEVKAPRQAAGVHHASRVVQRRLSAVQRIVKDHGIKGVRPSDRADGVRRALLRRRRGGGGKPAVPRRRRRRRTWRPRSSST